ncbi:MAG: TRAP transporter small permease [Bacteroidota bacterium]
MKNKLLKILEYLLVGLVALMTIDVIWQVASRYLLGSPSNFTDELAGFLLIWVGLFGAAYATGKDVHVSLDILPASLGRRKRFYLHIVAQMMVALFALSVMVIGGIHLVYLTFLLEQKSASLQIPLGYVYASIPICGLFIIYFSVHSAITYKMEVS